MGDAGVVRASLSSNRLKNLLDFGDVKGWQTSNIDAVFDAKDAKRWRVIIRESRKRSNHLEYVDTPEGKSQ